jgi:hypothetical protein
MLRDRPGDVVYRFVSPASSGSPLWPRSTFMYPDVDPIVGLFA